MLIIILSLIFFSFHFFRNKVLFFLVILDKSPLIKAINKKKYELKLISANEQKKNPIKKTATN